MSAKMLDRLQIPYKEAIVHGASHAGYYPGAIMMDIKINFSPEDGSCWEHKPWVLMGWINDWR